MTDASGIVAVLRLLVSLGVVLTLIVVLARWAMKRGVGRVGGPGAGLDVEVLARRGLGRGSAVQVVRVGEQVLVLGVTDQHVTLLRELPPVPVAGEEPSAADPGPVSPVLDFESVLAARTAEAERAPAFVGATTRAERRALERGRPARSSLGPVPSGWPWNAAALVVGVLRGSRA